MALYYSVALNVAVFAIGVFPVGTRALLRCPIFFFFFLFGSSLLVGTINYSRSIPCAGTRISHFSKDTGSILLDNSVRK